MMTKTRILAAGVAAALLGAGAAHAGEVVLHKGQHFRDEALVLRDAAPSLVGLGFSNQVASIEVVSGRWEFCSEPHFRGNCRVLTRGRYPELDYTMDSVSSVRELGAVAEAPRAPLVQAPRERYVAPPPEARREWREERRDWGYGARPGNAEVELFAGVDFKGRVLRLDRDARDLDRRNFDGRASSMVIHEGRWEVCTQPHFEGRCRVLDPGAYPHLGRLDDRIGSMRRIG